MQVARQPAWLRPAVPQHQREVKRRHLSKVHGVRKEGKLLAGGFLLRVRAERAIQAPPGTGTAARAAAPGRPREDILQSRPVHTLSLLDRAFLRLFRRKMAEEVGWDSPLAGYEGLVEVAQRLMAKYPSKDATEEATVRILRSLFPPGLLYLFRLLVAPIGGGRPAAILTARVTQLTCSWLMGPCQVNDVSALPPGGPAIPSGVLVERCRYLEELQCAAACVHTCKMPTQAFISRDMGVPLTMEPNFEDLSCQFKFGVAPPPREEDEAIRTPCLTICKSASRAPAALQEQQGCPQVTAS